MKSVPLMRVWLRAAGGSSKRNTLKKHQGVLASTVDDTGVFSRVQLQRKLKLQSVSNDQFTSFCVDELVFVPHWNGEFV